jgi:AcrR family transcriptional regulator
MVEIQRARIVAATVQAIEAVGYPQMRTSQVIARARVSRRTFYDVFADLEDCFLAAFEQTHLRIWRAMSEACCEEQGWRERLRSGLAELLVFIEEEPGLARLWIIDALSGGARVLERRAEILAQFAEVVGRGSLASDKARQPSDIVALGLVGGVFAVLHARLINGFDGPPTELLNPLMSMIVLPYLGPRVAGRELERPPLEPLRKRLDQDASAGSDPLAGLNMRVTYRTIQALTAIARHPGSSNRTVAEMSGILDDGQISKLLNRLAGLGLIENLGGGHQLGLANAWQLTSQGSQLVNASGREGATINPTDGPTRPPHTSRRDRR